MLDIPLFSQQVMVKGNVAELHKELDKKLKNVKNVTFEIIFVDDGSKDGTLKAVEKLQKNIRAAESAEIKANF